jgi:hypothetical protein
MPYPSSGIVDDFNRADQWPPGASWAGNWGTNGWQVKANRLTNLKGGWDGIYWNTTYPSADYGAYITVVAVGADTKSLQVHIRRDNAADTAYFVSIYKVAGSGGDNWELYRRIAAADTVIASDYTATRELAVGDQYGISVNGSTITAWHKPVGGSWTAVLTATDTQITAAGAAGLFSNDIGWIVDDFRADRAVAVDTARDILGRFRVPKLTGAPASPQIGEIYYDTGTNILYWWNGSTWIPAQAGGASGMTKIADRLVGAPTASMDFMSIPQTYTDLVLHGVGRVDFAGSAVAAGLRFNGDAGANYDYQMVYGSASTAYGQQALANTLTYSAWVPGTGLTTGRCCAFAITIPCYRSTAFWKEVLSKFGHGGNLGAYTTGTWRSTAAITQIQFIAGGANWIPGSRCILYGVG